MVGVQVREIYQSERLGGDAHVGQTGTQLTKRRTKTRVQEDVGLANLKQEATHACRHTLLQPEGVPQRVGDTGKQTVGMQRCPRFVGYPCDGGRFCQGGGLFALLCTGSQHSQTCRAGKQDFLHGVCGVDMYAAYGGGMGRLNVRPRPQPMWQSYRLFSFRHSSRVSSYSILVGMSRNVVTLSPLFIIIAAR